jgi:hypothetical protein
MSARDLPSEKQKMLDRLHRSDNALVGKRVLVVDDDVRRSSHSVACWSAAA